MEKELTEDYNGESLAGYIRKMWNLPEVDLRTYSPLTLAFIGDSIYDLIVRTLVVESGNAPVNKLHKQVTKQVQATAQAELFHRIQELLTEEELTVYKRGRNAKSFTSAKNAGIVEYRTATGLEALFGYLYLSGQISRILELIKPALTLTPIETK